MVGWDRAARRLGVRPLIGCELTMEPLPGVDTPDPELLVDRRDTVPVRRREQGRHHLTLLVVDGRGFRNLSRVLSLANLAAARKGRGAASGELLAEHAEGLIALSGCKRFGLIPRLLRAGSRDQAIEVASGLRGLSGAPNFLLELQSHLLPDAPWLCAELADLGREVGIACVATNDVHMLVPADKPLQDVLVSIRERGSLDEAATQGYLAPNAERFLKTREEMEQALLGPGGQRTPIGLEPWLRRAYLESLDKTAELADPSPS